MTKRERVIAALNFEKTDFVPYSINLTSQMQKKMTEYTGNPDYISTLGNHMITASMSMPFTEVKPGFYMDEYGVVWNRSGVDKDIGVVDNLVLADCESLVSYELPPVNVPYLRNLLEQLQKDDEKRFRVASLGFSLFERAWTLRGMENLLCDMIIEPEFVHELLKKIMNRNLQIVDIAMEYDIDAMYFGDDWGMQKGLIMGADCWRTFIKPYLSQMYSRVHKAGKFVIQHSCGDIRDVMDDLHEIGLNLYQTFQPEIYGYDYAKDLYKRISVWGGISTQRDLPVKMPDEVKVVTRDLLAHFPAGGLVAAPTHDVPYDAKPENIMAMMEVLHNQ